MSSPALVPITYVTPEVVKMAGVAAIRSIAGMPGFDWVGLIPAAHLTEPLLVELCNLVNATTGAQPPA